MAMERHTGGGAGRALRSPAAIVLAVGGAGLSAVASLPPLAAVAVAAGGYALGAATSALVRRGGSGTRRERIDPFTLGEPWRQRVQAALSAQLRYDQAIRGTRDGPLRERLTDIGERLEAGVQECWRVANQGNALSQAVRTLGIGELRSRLAAAEAGDGAEADQRFAALRAQLGTAERLDLTAADVDARLTLLTARMDEAAARAIELSLGASTDDDVAGLGSAVDQVVDQLESLRLALGEVEGRP
ncbi:MAG: hypothetical protein WD232_10485 [Acidimicrobiales bacterium]